MTPADLNDDSDADNDHNDGVTDAHVAGDDELSRRSTLETHQDEEYS